MRYKSYSDMVGGTGTNYYTLEEFVSIHDLETCLLLGARGPATLLSG